MAFLTFADAASAQTVKYSAEDPFVYAKEERLSALIHKLKERQAIELLLGEGVEAKAKQASSARLYFPRSYPGLVLPGYVDAVKIEYSESGEVVHLGFTAVFKGSDPPRDTPPAPGTPGDQPAHINRPADRRQQVQKSTPAEAPPVEAASPRSKKP